MPAQTALRVGVVGCGRIAELRHLPALAEIDEACAVALADTDPTRLAGLGRRFGIARLHSFHVDLLADPEVDAVAVCVPASAHAAVALDALAAGKHVLLEKPLCLSLDDADRLVEAAARGPCATLLAFNLRWHRLVREARALLRAGAVGEVDAVRTLWTSDVADRRAAPAWRRSRERGGGTLLEIATHHLDLLRFLLDDEIVEVSAASRSGEWDDEAVVVTGRLRSGALFTCTSGQRSAHRNEVEVIGAAGSLRVSLYRHDGLEVARRGDYVDTPPARARRALGAAASLPAAIRGSRRGGDYVASYRAQWRHFAAVAAGSEVAECTFEDGRRNLEALLAAADSAESGLPVRPAVGAPPIARSAP